MNAVPMNEDHQPHHHHAHDDLGRGHAHVAGKFGVAFAVGIALNLAFVIVEAAYGIAGNSVALISDAGHNFSDVLSLIVAWGAGVLSRRLPSRRYTYGLRSTSILAALINAVLLLVAVGGITVEAIQRLISPAPVSEMTVIAVAGIAYLHMAADAAVSLGVVAAGVAMLETGWTWLDPVVSLIIAAIIFIGTWRLLRDSVNLALNAVPEGIEPDHVHLYLNDLPGVEKMHDLHVWAMSTTETALTCHLVMPAGHPGDLRIAEIAKELHDRFGIAHVTIQVETGDPAAVCVLVPDHVV